MARRRNTAAPEEQLAEYHRKRDFQRTPEPAGDTTESASGRLYIVQKHAARRLHYDLRLELDGVLKSWAIPKGPSLDPSSRMLAVQTEDHPIEYGSFEGIIPAGEYGGGTVMLWDQGEWEPIGDPLEGYQRGDLKFRLLGRKLRGEWVLVRMAPKPNERSTNWLLIKKRDDAARSLNSFDVLAELPRSVFSGRTMEEIAADPGAVWTAEGARRTESATAGRPDGVVAMGRVQPQDPGELEGARKARQPAKLAPQLATADRSAPDDDRWVHEIKLDGYRLICVINQGAARLFTRNGHDWTDRFPLIERAALRLPIEKAIIDGEVVVLDAEGKSDFQALQNAFSVSTGRGFNYYVFDVPFAGGYDLRRAPLEQRKALLHRLVQAAPLVSPTIQYSDHIVGRGPRVYDEAVRAGLEGIISKRRDAEYEDGRRTRTWLKIKASRSEDFVVGGFSPPSGSRTGFGALLLGQYDLRGQLIYRGRVGTGFNEETLRSLEGIMRARARKTAPFVNPELDPEYRIVTWIEPELVAQVQFSAWTNEGLVRHGAFRGLHEDRGPKGVVIQDATELPVAPLHRSNSSRKVVRKGRSPDDAIVAGVRISNPQRTVYPEDGVTKLDVARYYEQIAEWILPHVTHRPLSVVRCPTGLSGGAFYQRHLGEGFPEPIDGIEVGDPEGPHLLIRDLAGLISLAQMGVLEIHPWQCRADNVERPDQLVFDLDPGPGIDWEHIVESARFVRLFLDQLGLRSFVKTSGGKGLHLVVPITRRSDWDEAKAVSKAIAEEIVRMAPRNFVAVMTKSRRAQKIFVDYLRNQRTATSVAAYSTRARNGAPVSAPLSWDELSAESEPRFFTVRTLPSRMRTLHTDPWEGFTGVRQSITAAMKKRLGL